MALSGLRAEGRFSPQAGIPVISISLKSGFRLKSCRNDSSGRFANQVVECRCSFVLRFLFILRAGRCFPFQQGFQPADKDRLYRVLIVATGTVNAVAPAGATAAPSLCLALIELVSAKSAYHRHISRCPAPANDSGGQWFFNNLPNNPGCSKIVRSSMKQMRVES